jgi:cobalt-zinc-cadmium efflux system outer membrane protein
MADSLTAARVVDLARSRAPEARLAETRVLEARGRLAGARALAQENPEIEAVANSDERFERRSEVEVTVPLGFGIRRLQRMGVARAEVEGEERLLADARGRAIGTALAAWYRVLHAERRVALAREAGALTAELERAAEERFRSGDAARLDLNVAVTEHARAESDFHSRERDLAAARAGLAAALGLSSGGSLAMSGDLGDRTLLDAAVATADPARRPDVQAAESESRAASRALGLARTALLPDLALRWKYGHEGGESVERAGLAVTVPLFNHGQAERGEARARRERARIELERRRAAAASEAEGARAAYASAVAAAQALGERGVPRALETEGMALESYRAGKADLAAVLFARRAALDTRIEHLDRELDAALAAIDLAVATGALR